MKISKAIDKNVNNRKGDNLTKNINFDRNIKFDRNVNFDRNIKSDKKINLTQRSTIYLHLPHLLPFDDFGNLSLLYRKEIQTFTIFNSCLK